MGGYGSSSGWQPSINSPSLYPGYLGQVAPPPPPPPAVTFPQVSSGGGGYGGGGGYPPGYWESIQASAAADQAAQVAFTEWTMRTGDERLAMEKAQQAWSHTFQERQQAFSEGVTEAGLLGTYEGQQTQQAQQQAWSQGFNEQQLGQQGALSLLQQQAALQGPRDAFRYQALNQNTPGGLRDVLAGLAGRYNFAGSGYQGTPGAATLQSRTQDLLSGGNLGSGGAGQAGPQSAGAGAFALPNPNQIDLANWGRLTPSAQQMTLGAYEQAGFYGSDVEEALRRAAPRYVGPSAAQVAL